MSETKLNWKVQRDHEERDHSIDSIKQSIEDRKPDFDAYIDAQKKKKANPEKKNAIDPQKNSSDPQKKKADVIIQVPRAHTVRDPCKGNSGAMT